MAILHDELGAVLSKAALIELFDRAAEMTAEERRELADAVCWGRPLPVLATEAPAVVDRPPEVPKRRGRRDSFTSLDDYVMAREGAIRFLRATSVRSPEQHEIAHQLCISERTLRNWEKKRLGG